MTGPGRATKRATSRAPGRAPSRALPAAALLLAVCLGAGCTRLPTRAAPPAAPYSWRGVAFTDWTPDGYAAPRARQELARAAATGANAVSVVVTAYQPSATRGLPAADSSRTPTPAAVARTVAWARGLGLAVALKPHVDLENGAWRGTLDPPDPKAWFAAYRAFLLPWAAVAESTGAALFVVGTELGSTVDHPGAWRALIRDVRAVYSGRLVYAASWDEADRIGFWDALDYVGIDFYAPVAVRPDPGRVEILSGWMPWMGRLGALQARAGLPVLLTEIGYRSVDGAGMDPFTFGTSGRADPAEQADLYWAALQAVADRPWVAGLFWWDWPAAGGGGTGDTGYSPEDKPAGIELLRAWGPEAP